MSETSKTEKDAISKTEKDALREMAKRFLKLRDEYLRLSNVYEGAYNDILAELNE